MVCLLVIWQGLNENLVKNLGDDTSRASLLRLKGHLTSFYMYIG